MFFSYVMDRAMADQAKERAADHVMVPGYPGGDWKTAQIAMGAILTGYDGTNWDYLLGKCPYIPVPWST